jgi:hypothetical protein
MTTSLQDVLVIARLLLIASFAVLSFGCGGPAKSYKTAHVGGTVTLDGQFIDKGVINFIGDTTGEGSAEIVAGKFSAVDVPLGKVRIFVVATRETGKMVPGSSEPVPEIESIIPSKYSQGIEAEIAGDETDRKIELGSMD